MKTFRIAALALAVAGVFATEAKAGSTTNNWWDVTFDDKLAECIPGDPKWDPMIVLTNRTITNDGVQVSIQTWDTGFWTTLDGDETSVTNEFNPTNTFKQYGDNMCLKLDTQGNDLTWRVDDGNTMADALTALVDADLYLVGSDSPPDAADFDADTDVQTAVYLKNETNEDTGETTNSVLCVYVYDSAAEANYWQELKGVELKDNSWASVKVVVDHAQIIEPGNLNPMVQVFVNGVKMTARDGNTDYWTAANAGKSQTAGRVSSVAFRGTGAVDNFVGKLVETTYDSYNFTAQVFMDGTNVLATGTEGNVTRTIYAEAGAGKSVTFANFLQDDLWIEWPEDDEDEEAEPVFHVSYALTKIEFINLGTGETTTFNYSYSDHRVVPETVNEDLVHLVSSGEPPYAFSVMAPTEGATKDDTIVKVFFETLPSDGDFKLTASQNVGEAPPDQTFNTNSLAVDETTFTFAQSLTAGGKSYILSTLTVGATPAGIEAAISGTDVVVTVPLSDQIAEGIYNVATATYVEGTLADGETLQGARDGNVYTYTKYTPPVAIIVAGAVTNGYDSLRDAVTNATAGDTIYLLRDDALSFSAESDEMLEIVIDKALTIDGGSHTLFGVSGYSAGGFHDIFVVGSGALTIKDLKFSEFGDTATSFQYETYPIVTSGNYTGQLTLDGVTIDKFARTAVNLNGGTVLITNCTFTADPTAYYQTGVETLNAVVTVVDTTITGVNSTITGEDPEGAAVFTLKGHDGYTGTGSITVLSGDYTGQFIVAAEALATGSAILSNGTFVATAPASESAFNLDAGTVTVAGGWYDREPEAKYIAAGLSAVDYGNEAPDARATWTVGTLCTITFNHEDDTLILTTNVLAGTTNYAPAEDPAPVDGRLGVTFAGWTNKVAGGAVVLTKDLPAADGNATWTATFGPLVIVKPAVNPGDGLKDYVPGEGETVPAPIEFTDDAAPKCEISFVAPESGWYVLYSSTTVDGEYTEDTASGKTVAKGELTTLVETTPGTTKFFKIYWSASAPAGD